MIIEAALLALSFGGTPDTMKCPNSLTLPGIEEGGWALVVDGAIVGSDQDEIDRGNLEALEVTCWDPETGKIPADVGVRLIHVVSRDHAALAFDAMAEFAEARSAFVQASGAEPTSLDALAAHGLDDLERFDFRSTAEGWTVATAGGQAFRCTVSSTDSAESAPTCETDYGAAARSLRERWDRGVG